MINDFEDLSQSELDELLAVRHHLHRNPEPSWQEFETTQYLRTQLEQMPGVKIYENGLETGLLAVIEGFLPAEGEPVTVALRADIDSIAGTELWKSDVCSQKPGLMHACGHDFHSTALLGAARLLLKHQKNFAGKVLLIFQPAEETTDGARALIAKGLFDRFHPRAIFGLHNRPEVQTGQVIVQPTALMAAKINFEIEVCGVGGHGSMPHKCVDPLVCAASMIQTVLTIPSRNIDPMKALVCSICSIHGGTPQNLIVDRVEMTGSMRYLDPEVGKRAFERLQTIVASTADCFECKATLNVVEKVPAVINHPLLYPIALDAAKQTYGEDHILQSDPCLATEDFADYMQQIPGFFYWVGNCKAGDHPYAWHNAQFHVDDEALPQAAKLLALSALNGIEALGRR